MYGWALAAREEDLVGHEHQEAGGELKVVWGGRERGCLGAKTWWHRRFPGDTGVLLMKRSVSVCQSSECCSITGRAIVGHFMGSLMMVCQLFDYD